MLYKKLTFDQLHFTESDRQELIDYFDHQVIPTGYGKPFYFDKLTNSPPYLDFIFKKFPFLIGKMMLIKTTKDAESLDYPTRHIHIDSRPTALNIPLYKCNQGADTVFFEPADLQEFKIPVYNNSRTMFPGPGIEKPRELGRFTLEMDSAYILDTTVPHTKIQTYDEVRFFLSLVSYTPFAEAVKYFE
jgi:hypothetical protein